MWEEHSLILRGQYNLETKTDKDKMRKENYRPTLYIIIAENPKQNISKGECSNVLKTIVSWQSWLTLPCYARMA